MNAPEIPNVFVAVDEKGNILTGGRGTRFYSRHYDAQRVADKSRYYSPGSYVIEYKIIPVNKGQQTVLDREYETEFLADIERDVYESFDLWEEGVVRVTVTFTPEDK